VLGA
jgi:hypothetical protein